MTARGLIACVLVLLSAALAAGCAGTGLNKGEAGERKPANEAEILKSEEEAFKREEVAELNQMREDLAAIESEKRELATETRVKHREAASKANAKKREQQAEQKARQIEEGLTRKEREANARVRKTREQQHRSSTPGKTRERPKETSSEAVPQK